MDLLMSFTPIPRDKLLKRSVDVERNRAVEKSARAVEKQSEAVEKWGRAIEKARLAIEK